MKKPVVDSRPARVIGQGRFLTLVEEAGWEYVIRPHVRGIVVMVPITPDGELVLVEQARVAVHRRGRRPCRPADRKSTRLNSSHVAISYAVFCLKKKKKKQKKIIEKNKKNKKKDI